VVVYFKICTSRISFLGFSSCIQVISVLVE